RMHVSAMEPDLVATHRADDVVPTELGQDLGAPRMNHELRHDALVAQDVRQPDRRRVDLGVVLVIGVLVADDDQNVHPASLACTLLAMVTLRRRGCQSLQSRDEERCESKRPRSRSTRPPTRVDPPWPAN